jgi:hypothetical protein
MPIDEVVFGRILPDEIGTCRHEGDAHRRLPMKIAHEHGGLARGLPLDQPIARHRCHARRRFVHRQSGHVPRRAIGKGRRHVQLHFVGRLDKDLLARRHGDAFQPRGARHIVDCSAGNPIAQQAILLGVAAEPHAPFVRQLHGRLLQDQARLRLKGVDAAPKLVGRKGGEIELGILAAQREFEPPFAVLVAVARSLIAARLREDRHDLVAEADLRLAACRERREAGDRRSQRQNNRRQHALIAGVGRNFTAVRHARSRWEPIGAWRKTGRDLPCSFIPLPPPRKQPSMLLGDTVPLIARKGLINLPDESARNIGKNT